MNYEDEESLKYIHARQESFAQDKHGSEMSESIHSRQSKTAAEIMFSYVRTKKRATNTQDTLISDSCVIVSKSITRVDL